MTVIIEKLYLNVLKLRSGWQNTLSAVASGSLKIPRNAVTACEILSASVDSRRGNPKLLLKLRVDTDREFKHLSPASKEELAAFDAPTPEIPARVVLKNPIVIGTGPAGISAAWYLAKAGCDPIILDRGAPVEKRTEDHRKFLLTRQLDENSNLLIGEGGAGTFSDGKLHTGTRDSRARFLKQLWVRCGAPEEILWQSRPHIGSDKLPEVCANLRREIEALGGCFRFNSEVADFIVENNCCRGVILASGEKLFAPAVICAPGLGGRSIIRKLCSYAEWELKPFQTGCRVETPQEIIDRAMYHLPHRPEALGAAEYHIVSRSKAGNVSSFCMCPGGSVVNASAWDKRSITNGMSRFARDGKFANSCLITTIVPDEFSCSEEIFTVFEQLEREIFLHGGEDYTLPAQDVSAFLKAAPGLKNSETSAETGIVPGRLDQLLLPQLCLTLIPAAKNFDARIPGFIRHSKFIGAESFVSSPVRITRDPVSMQNPGLRNLFPAGEGCGLAGGIVSAACDGLRAAVSAVYASC